MMKLYKKRIDLDKFWTRFEQDLHNRGLTLLKHAGWLQDAWNSVGCFRDGYYSISDDPGGARGPLMTCG